MAKIVVVGSSNTDMVVTTPRIPVPGETIMGNDFSIHPGGKGANQAVAAARASASVTFIARVGDDDFGRRAVEGYKADKINIENIFTDPHYPTGVAVITVEESGQNSIVVAGGANERLSVEDIKKATSSISEADVMLVQLEVPLETIAFSLKMAKEFGIKTILDPAPAKPLSDEIFQMVDIITPNETEAEILTGINPSGDKEIEMVAAHLIEKVNEAVIITLGSRGVFFLSREGDKGFISAEKVKNVDSTAAGDVFSGYLAAALGNGDDYRKAITLANKAASVSVTKNGAQPSIPHLREIN